MADAARLFDEHYQSLYRYLVRFSGDAELAADAAQEAFLKLVERPPPDDGAARAWLFKVATNAALETARTRARRTRLLAASPARAPVGDAPRSPEDYVAAEEQRRLVGEALAALPNKERTALLMREEGFSHREIAVAVSTTTGSVGTLVARALARLAEKLALDRDDV
jgi:RNA polymerase sigma-70 factor (ECF subfamily)